MLTIAETRRARLEMLIEAHGGSLANLNAALDWPRNDARLARIRNANARHERGGKPYAMGDELARAIEVKLDKERGWMDQPPGSEAYASDHLRSLHEVAQELEPYQIETLTEIANTLARRGNASVSTQHTSGSNAAPQAHTAPTDSASSTGLSAVSPRTPKKIGKGYFGPADAGDGGKQVGTRIQPGKGGQKRHTGSDR